MDNWSPPQTITGLLVEVSPVLLVLLAMWLAMFIPSPPWAANGSGVDRGAR